MIAVSLIYAIVTILLAGVDAIRIYFAKKQGKDNIDHRISVILAVGFGPGSYIYWYESHLHLFSDLQYVGALLILAVAFGFIRLTLYDITLNLLRGLRIDYVSSKTNSWTDNHLRMDFWRKRLIAVISWGVLFAVYKNVFKL